MLLNEDPSKYIEKEIVKDKNNEKIQKTIEKNKLL